MIVVPQPSDPQVEPVTAVIETSQRPDPPPIVDAPRSDPPPFDPTILSGVYHGQRSGRPLELQLTFDPSGTVSGMACVTVGPRRFERPVAGTWTAAPDGVVIVIDEGQGPRPVTYRGTVGSDRRAEGTWSDRGRARGPWSADG